MADLPRLEAAEESAVRELYQRFIAGWNARDAGAIAGVFAEDGHVVGFDGSMIDGPAALAEEMGRIFANHQTAAYLAKVREVQAVAPGAAMLRAVVGMLPPGAADINPAVNAIQTLVARKQAGSWQAALLQTTPAQFHGRPELAEQLTAELRELLPHPEG